jgi:hypothetical protein
MSFYVKNFIFFGSDGDEKENVRMLADVQIRKEFAQVLSSPSLWRRKGTVLGSKETGIDSNSMPIVC